MNILEQEIEDLVWNTLASDPKALRERGFPYDQRYTYERQLVLGNYGRADIVGFRVHQMDPGSYRRVDIDIIELKRDQVNTSTLMQAVRYATGLRTLFEYQGYSLFLCFNLHLIGKSIDKQNEFCYFPDLFDNVCLYTYGIDLTKGIVFTKHEGYSLEDSGIHDNSYELFPLLKHNLKKNITSKWAFDKKFKELTDDDSLF